MHLHTSSLVVSHVLDTSSLMVLDFETAIGGAQEARRDCARGAACSSSLDLHITGALLLVCLGHLRHIVPSAKRRLDLNKLLLPAGASIMHQDAEVCPPCPHLLSPTGYRENAEELFIANTHPQARCAGRRSHYLADALLSLAGQALGDTDSRSTLLFMGFATVLESAPRCAGRRSGTTWRTPCPGRRAPVQSAEGQYRR